MMRKTAMAIPLILMTACSSLVFASETATNAPYNAKLENTPEQHQQPKARREARSDWPDGPRTRWSAWRHRPAVVEGLLRAARR